MLAIRNREPEEVVSAPQLVALQPIRLFLIESQPLVATALAHFFDANLSFKVVGTAKDIQAPELLSTSPDIVVIFQEHGGTNVSDMVRLCRGTLSTAKICVIACHAHTELAQIVLKAGATGYAVNDQSSSDIVDALFAIDRGGVSIDPRVSAELSPIDDGSEQKHQTLHHLTLRESQILKLLADGDSNQDISVRLQLSTATIKNHLTRIYGKLKVTTRTQAVLRAFDIGIA